MNVALLKKRLKTTIKFDVICNFRPYTDE